MKPISYYKQLLEENPKWLGTQAVEILHHYAELEKEMAKLQKKQDREPDVVDSEIEEMSDPELELANILGVEVDAPGGD
ncbi:hypothetical protein LCGC14_2863790 [marine sediment metagenome]|uniref:Uncharacterized protein n=1 Tax=marine sediment metagenome TaxID=412755 RepID=A0A0F8Y585_9ZZZZ